MYKDVSNSQDVIDSRDIIARIDDLQSDLDDLEGDLEDKLKSFEEAQEVFDKLKKEWEDGSLPEEELEELEQEKNEAEREFILAQEEHDKAQEAIDDWDDNDEYDALIKLKQQCEGYGDWGYGETLIADSYFVEYAQELAEDIGAVNTESDWPNNFIDWEKAADELKIDYMCVDYDGIDFWMRA